MVETRLAVFPSIQTDLIRWKYRPITDLILVKKQTFYRPKDIWNTDLFGITRCFDSQGSTFGGNFYWIVVLTLRAAEYKGNFIYYNWSDQFSS